MASTNLLYKDLGKATCRSGSLGEILGRETREEASLEHVIEAVRMSKCLVRIVSHKLKKKKKNFHGGDETKEGRKQRKVSPGCLSLYVKGGGCKIGTCKEFDFNSWGKSSSTEECMPHRAMSRIERTGLECFPHGMPERFRKKSVRKAKEAEQLTTSSAGQISLPDDVLEMCLVRLPLTALMTARLVCKKWKYLTTTPHFMQMRSEGSHWSPWLFLFGVIKDDCYAGEIHALDVSLDHWHRINADVLKGRFLFSVASIGTDLYVVGGCSSLTTPGTFADKNSTKIHKGVLVFNPLTGSWRKAAPMRSARSAPVLGVFEVSSSCAVFHRLPDRQDRCVLKSRIGGVSDVYDDPHRFSLRRQLRDAFNESGVSSESKREPSGSVRQGRNNEPRFILIVVGGQGSWDEPLNSGEIYDPLTNRWMEIAKLPADFGAACSGTVCNGVFYVYSDADKIAGYDLERATWVAIQTSRPPPRLREYYPKIVSCNGRLFVLCVSWGDREGQLSRREKAVRKLWELDLTFLTWSEVSRHPDAPMDWNAAFVADRNRIFGVEMFKIFGQVLGFLTVCDVSDEQLKWTRISRKQAAHEVDASLCSSKSMAVLQL